MRFSNTTQSLGTPDSFGTRIVIQHCLGICASGCRKSCAASCAAGLSRWNIDELPAGFIASSEYSPEFPGIPNRAFQGWENLRSRQLPASLPVSHPRIKSPRFGAFYSIVAIANFLNY